MQFGSPTNITATLAPGSAVSVTNTVAVDGSGHTQPVSGTVSASGATTGTAPTGTAPTFASRQVNSTSAASATVTNPPNPAIASATLIAAPGVNNFLELHGVNVNCHVTSGSVGSTVVVSLQRSDNAAILWQRKYTLGASTSSDTADSYDFQGTTLPSNVGINLVSNLSIGNSGGTDVANINYSVVS